MKEFDSLKPVHPPVVVEVRRCLCVALADNCLAGALAVQRINLGVRGREGKVLNAADHTDCRAIHLVVTNL